MDMQGGAAVSTEEVVEGLNDLLQLDHDAIGSYEIAIEKLEDRDHASQISGFKLDHERHIRELNELILALGGTPKNEPHATGPLKEAMQSLGAKAGDRGTLIAWRANELQVRTKYDSYAAKANRWPDYVKRVVDQAALDEERHYQWVANVLQTLGVGSGEGLETDLANKLRERTTQAGYTMDSARDRVASAAEGVRERAGEAAAHVSGAVGGAAGAVRNSAADLLEGGASRLDGAARARPEGGRMAGAAQTVAGGMESTADFIRSPDVARLRGEVESMIRETPGRTLLGTFLVGFVIGRILR